MNKKKTINCLQIVTLLLVPLILTSCASVDGTETVKNESVEIRDLPDKITGEDLVQITTESGHTTNALRSSIPIDENGNPYWRVVHVQPNETLTNTGVGASMIPGIGDAIGGGIFLLTGLFARNQQKQKQAALDARQKGERDLGLRDKLLVSAAVGVEIATTDGAIKDAIKKGMTKREQDLFDEITGPERAKVQIDKLAVKASQAQ